MRPENEDVLLRFAQAMDARSFPEDLFTSDFLMVNPPHPMFENAYRGHEGAQQWLTDLTDAFADSWRSSHDVVTDGPGWLVGRFRVEGTGSTSGAPLELRWAGVLWIRDGRLAKAEGFMRTREALVAAGVQ